MEKVIPILNSCTITGDRSTSFFIDRFEDYLEKHQRLVFPHRHQFYHLVLFTEGNGSFSIDFEQYAAKDWRAYFMSPGQIHTWNLSSPIKGFVINVDKKFFETFLLRSDYLDQLAFFKGYAEDGIIDVPNEARKSLLQQFENLLNQYRDDTLHHPDLIRASLLVILLRFLEIHNGRIVDRELKHYSYHTLQKFQSLIEKHFRSNHLPKEYAAMLNLSSNHLNSLCRTHLGKQAGELIRNRIVLEAKRLLVISGLSIAEIADELCFNDHSYFTKFFKKQTSLTPEEFRQKKNFNPIK